MNTKHSINLPPAGHHHSPDLVDLQVAAVEATAHAVVITDRMGTVVWVNPAFEELTGYTSAEIVGENTHLLKSGVNPPGLYEAMWRTILDGRVWHGELVNRRKDGSLYDEEMTIAPLRDGAGEVGHFVGVKRDVTDRKLADKKMHMLLKAVESSPELIGMAGPDGTILYVNAALQKALQWSEEDLAGKHFRNILSPNNSPALLRDVERTSSQPGGWTGECLVPRKDGSDLRVLLSSSAVMGDGQVLGMLGIAQDITERRRADERIALLSQALENTSEFIGLGDTNTNITFANQAWLQALGYSARELIGQRFDFILSPNNPAELVQELYAKTFAGGWTGECLQRHRSGSDRSILLSTGLLKDREGQFTGVFAIARDITERKQAEQDILFKNTLLEAQAETSMDGILAVDETNKIILSNQQFAKIWGVPAEFVRAGDDNRVLQHVIEQVENSDQFAARVDYLYQHRDEKSKDQIRHKDGRVLDRYSSPLIDAAGKYRGRIWYFSDITERIRAQERLQLWSHVLDHSAEGIFICDPQERILLVNMAFEKLTGFSANEAIGKTPRILHSGRQDQGFYAEMWTSVTEKGAWQGEIWNRRKGGEFYIEWLSISAVSDPNGLVTHYVGIFSDITNRKQDQQRIAHLAHHDALTGLPNRVLLMDRVDQAIKAAQRRSSTLAVIFIDLDRFKDVNDSLGHDAGDLLLQTLAGRFGKAIRSEDTLARIGGDEFVAVIQDLHDGQDAAIVARDLLSRLLAPISLNGYELTVTASIGISLYPNDATNEQELIRNADAAMYQAKGGGRNAYHFYTRDLNQRALEMLSRENSLRRAIESREFVLHYQPQIDIRTGCVVGAEALIRWNHPERGLLMPGKFISVAEERGLIVRIGTWVIEEAARQAALWNKAGISKPVAVNVSAIQFRQKNFVEQLAKIVQRNGISPNCIELELTESIIMRDAETTIEILEQLHRMGFQLSIDDFGTGYSSLSYLRRFPIDKIKIDQSFLKGLLHDESATGIVTAIIGLARSLRLKVIAEGVETNEQLELLRQQGCDLAQGFLFSPALVAQQFEKLIHEWKPAHPTPAES